MLNHAQEHEADLAMEYHLVITEHMFKTSEQIIIRFLIILITAECIFDKNLIHHKLKTLTN